MAIFKTLANISKVVLNGIEHTVKDGVLECHSEFEAAARSLGFKHPSELPKAAAVEITTGTAPAATTQADAGADAGAAGVTVATDGKTDDTDQPAEATDTPKGKGRAGK